MSAAYKITPDASAVASVDRFSPNPGESQRVMSALVPARGQEGVVEVHGKNLAPRGGSCIFAARVARVGRIQLQGPPFHFTPEVLFSDEGIAKFDGLPLVLEHDAKRVVGFTMLPRIETERFIVADLFVHAPRVKRAIDLGRRALSYRIDFSHVVRHRDGEPQTFVTDFTIAHIAIVRRAADPLMRILNDDEERAMRDDGDDEQRDDINDGEMK